MCLAAGDLDSNLLSSAVGIPNVPSGGGVGVGTHLPYEPKEGGLERRDGNWSAVLTLRGQSM